MCEYRDFSVAPVDERLSLSGWLEHLVESKVLEIVLIIGNQGI